MSYSPKKHKRFTAEKVGVGAFIIIWVLGALATVAFWVFVVWVVIQLLQHFGVV